LLKKVTGGDETTAGSAAGAGVSDAGGLSAADRFDKTRHIMTPMTAVMTTTAITAPTATAMINMRSSVEQRTI